MRDFIFAAIGFVVAPLTTAIIGALLAPIGGGRDPIAFGLIPVFFFFAALATAVFGVPSFLLLRHFKLIEWWSTLLVGLFIGVVSNLISQLPSRPVLSQNTLNFALIGAMSALSFWLVWRLRGE